MLSEEVKGVLKKNIEIILHDTPSKEILQSLHVKGVISSKQVTSLNKIDDDDDRNFELVAILKKRNDQDFLKFCKILQQYEATTIVTMGRDLEQQVLNCIGRSQVDEVDSNTLITTDGLQNQEQDKFDVYFDTIANQLAREDILRFGIKLSLSHKTVQDIISDIKITKSYDKVFKICQEWKEMKGKFADIKEVIKVLRSMKKNLIADSVLELNNG